MTSAVKNAAVLFCFWFFAACSPADKLKTDSESIISKSFCQQATAIVHVEVLGAEVVETLGDDKPGYHIHRVSGRIIRTLKGELQAGELFEYYNFIEAGLQYPPPGTLIVFLDKSAGRKTQKLEWTALENSEFIYTARLLREVEKCL